MSDALAAPGVDAGPTARPPRISLSGARAAYVGPALGLAPHRNAVATLAIAAGAPFELDLLEPGAAAAATRTRIALIPPGTLHHLRAGGDMAFVYLDALGDDLAALAALDLADAHARLLADGPRALREADVDTLCEALGVARRAAPDPRIARVARRLDARPQDFPRAVDAADAAGLSEPRFHALWRQAIGVPFRRYRLWRRMAVVLRAVAAGRTLTVTAHEAGFASSAHLSDTFRAMFGLSPSALAASGFRLAPGPAQRPSASSSS